MFLVKVLPSFISISLLIIFLGECFGSLRDKSTMPEEEWNLANTTRLSQEETEKHSKIASLEMNPFIYKMQLFNESLEKIQMMNNGMITKSAFIPIISNELALNYSEVNKEHCLREGLDQKNESVHLINATKLINQNNGNFVIKNGKKYRIVKVKKYGENIPENQPLNQLQRRNFKLLPNLLSILPFKWMTRERKNETLPETRSENATQWSKLTPVATDESSNEMHNYVGHNGGKIKKLLNLFTIVKFENEECFAKGIKGKCLRQVECETKGGKFTSTCAEELGVCCYNEKTCGETSSDERITYFTNEGFPDPSTTAPRVCTLTLEKTNSDIKQLRLDFQNFQLRQPTNGTCLHDRLIISGQDMNDVVPEICGTNTGQHVYVDVEDTSGPFTINIVTVGEYFPRNFRIKITQIKKDDELLAPKNCLQYYAEATGYVQTFNYRQEVNENIDEIDNGYFNNLNYAICIKKQKGFCSITYENEESDSRHPTFQLVNVDEDGERLLPPKQAGVETFDCPDDYIIIGGIRLCGEKLNDASFDVDYTRNYPVIDNTNGPVVISVRTDATVSGRGFYLKYVQNPCLN